MSIPEVEVTEQVQDIPHLDPAEVEKKMVERELKKQEQVDPLELASMMLTLYTPRFNALVDKLSVRQLRRVTKSLVEFPVGKTYRHTDPIEKEVFAIGKNLLDANYVLVANTYNENREILQQAAEAAANASIETVRGEEAQQVINNEEGNNNETST